MQYCKDGRYFDTFEEAFDFVCFTRRTCKGCDLHRIDEDGTDLCTYGARNYGNIPENVEKKICKLMGILRISSMEI